MKIRALFITRPHEPNSPELLTAWDEWSIDANSGGFEEDIAKQLKSVGSDLHAHAIVTITVPEADILNLLYPSGTVAGTVSS